MNKSSPKPRKKTSAAKSSKRWMRAIGGYSTLTYVSRILIGLGLVGIGAGLATYFQPTIKQADPLEAISHTTNAPDTSEILRLVNGARSGAQVQEVTTDDQLTAIAQERLKDMVQKQYYSHQNLKGQFYYNLFAEHKFQTAYSCENLDIDSVLTAQKYIDDWLKSNEGHKDCLLSSKVSKIGIATGEFSKGTKSVEKTYLVVTVYATPPMPLATN
jgi:uncharacterized protein YkwD